MILNHPNVAFYCFDEEDQQWCEVKLKVPHVSCFMSFSFYIRSDYAFYTMQIIKFGEVA